MEANYRGTDSDRGTGLKVNKREGGEGFT